ncbi:MAG TPA: aspartate aminotransferase family protein [bacterium]|nr:aspartate aminotransferase family protein [bacterium]
MESKKIIELTQHYVMNTYARLPIALAKGKGSWAWDADGKKYLDFFSGLAVNNLGHAHSKVLKTLQTQARELMHVSNVFHTQPQAELAELLVKNSFAGPKEGPLRGRAFFCNSGAEANEGAVKLARKWAKKKFGPQKFEVITMKNSFHGRTLAMITATGQEKYQKGFEPLMPGFRYAEFGNMESLKAQVTDATCAVLIEPIQGEGGVRMASAEYFRELRRFCDEKGLLLIFDEVQVGMGRTGKLFAYQHFGAEPDIMTLAKALASGLPVGAVVAKEDVAQTFEPGDHASTFGGNPLVAAVAKTTLETMLEPGFLENAAKLGDSFMGQLKKLKKRLPIITEVRGLGMMIAVDLDQPAKPIVLKCIEKGLLINAVQEKTLRILPPLTAKRSEMKEALRILAEVLEETAKGQGVIAAAAPRMEVMS